ncbi:DUF4349 domain-containing protein [Altererythrobacter sp. KTW20L]|uniref:DUF4349 domain-containing protein n=1 Tax=Altererythrobacter sp. KTW20L TaxID=2942210 RepID=UPI0020C0F935|nr:DUF4349 domain-containing protein [Altererythrobacter sp. KTW20L]MCL6249564.1 DUF4349 domain-containing protein [Altererythrobacter sp. KTW20L]
MRKATLFAGVLSLLASGCSDTRQSPREDRVHTEPAGGAPQNQFGFMEATASPSLFRSGGDAVRSAAQVSLSNAHSEPGAPRPQAAPVTTPMIAYNYSWGYQVDANDLPTLQQRHRELCEGMGERCRVLEVSQSGNDDYGYGEMRLQVAAGDANGFAEQLESATDGLDAKQISSAVTGEDLTEDIIDTEARVAARTALRDRLMDVLRNRQGSVGDLVEAERGVAEVNEELDAATNLLAHMRNRIAYSDVNIVYDPEMGRYNVGFLAPIAYAFDAIGSTLGVVIAGLIYLTVALIPITLFLLAFRWVWRKTRFRLSFRREEKTGSLAGTEGESA